MRIAISGLTAVTLLAIGPAVWAAPSIRQPVMFEIHAQSMELALGLFATQSGLQLLFPADGLEHATAPQVHGPFMPDAALRDLLAGSGLEFQFVNESTVAIKRASSRASVHTQLRLAEDTTSATSNESISREGVPPVSGGEKGVPEILVAGSRSMNADITRSKDDIQPYIVLDRKAIEMSGSSSVDDLLRNHTTMNYISATNSQNPGLNGNTSRVALRGLGDNETLVLIDGRRASFYSIAGVISQPDLNSIPVGAVERIEILPTTASGIYGGSATGGVVNVVLRRDYSGAEVKASYENTLRNDASSKRIDLSGGTSLFSGKTTVRFFGNYSDAEALYAADRDYSLSGRRQIFENVTSSVLSDSTPPLGATSNISSVEVFDLSTFELIKPNLVLKNGTALGSPITFVPRGYSGIATDAGQALVANAGQYNYELAETAQPAGGGRESLLTDPRIRSMSLSIRQKLTGSIDAFLDYSIADNVSSFPQNNVSSTFLIPATSQANPFTDDIIVTTPAFGADEDVFSRLRTDRAAFGLIGTIGGSWRGEIRYAFDKSRFDGNSPQSGLDPQVDVDIADGVIDLLRDTNTARVDFRPYLIERDVQLLPADTTLSSASIRIAGQIFDLRAGPVTLTSLLEYNKTNVDDTLQTGFSETFLYPSVSQTVRSVYFEASIPLASSERSLGFLKSFDLQLAARMDDYVLDGSSRVTMQEDGSFPDAIRASNRFDSVDPTVGVRLRPMNDIMLRASFGTGFLPPGMRSLIRGNEVTIPAFVMAARNLRDPRRGNELLGQIRGRSGGNPDLRPEESESWSAGAVFTPRFVAGLRVSVDWTRIKKTNNFTAFGLNQDSINAEQFVPGLITRGPTANDGYDVGPIVFFDGTTLNAARALMEAIDWSIDYSRPIVVRSSGMLSLAVSGTRMLHNVIQQVEIAPETEFAGIVSYPEWIANAGLRLEFLRFSAAWSARYVDSRWLNSSHAFDAQQAALRVSSVTTHDIYFGYEFDRARSDPLKGVRAEIGVRNLFDSRPHFVGASPFYDAVIDPRMSTYYLSVSKAF